MPQRSIPTVSVVMPAYNAAAFIAEAIDSMLAQTYTDFELVIVNDGSTDATRTIVLGYDDPRIRLIDNPVNEGICVSLNRGIDVSYGRYIARMDADDVSMPGRLECQVAYLDKHPDVVAVGTDIEVFGVGIVTKGIETPHTPADCAAGLIFNPCFAHPSVMMRADILSDNSLRYQAEYQGLEDFVLWWELRKFGKLTNIPLPLLRYRKHPAQETKKRKPSVQKAYTEFTQQRFRDLGITLSDKQLEVLTAYATGNFSFFREEELAEFMNLAKEVIDLNKQPAVKLTMAKAITYTINNSPTLQTNYNTLYANALRHGIFPLKWYLKVSLLSLL